MFKRNISGIIFFFAFCTLAASTHLVVQAADSAKSKETQLSNQKLVRMSDEIDGKLSARQARITQIERQLFAAEARLRAERLNYEQQMAEEEKAFLLYMKSMRPEEREDALQQFYEKQRKNRRRFDKDELDGHRKWFHDFIEARSDTNDISSEVSAGSMPPTEKPSRGRNTPGRP